MISQWGLELGLRTLITGNRQCFTLIFSKFYILFHPALLVGDGLVSEYQLLPELFCCFLKSVFAHENPQDLTSCFRNHGAWAEYTQNAFFKKEIITPGIRFNTNSNDQKRTLTPKQAYKNGSNWLVIGRPITKGNIKKNIQNLIDHLEK